MENEVYDTLKICYDKVVYIEGKGYLVPDGNINKWKLLDQSGNEIKSNINLDNPICSKTLIFDSSDLIWYYLIDLETFKRKDDFGYQNLVVLDNGAVIARDFTYNGYYGVIGSDGDIAMPFMYSNIKVCDKHRDYIELNVGYKAEYSKDMISWSKVRMYNDGVTFNHLGYVDISDDINYQILISDFRNRKNIKAPRINSYEHKIKSDRECWGLKFKPVYYGNQLTHDEYDIIIYDRTLKEYGYFLVGNIVSTDKRSKYNIIGVVSILGKIEVGLHNYNSIKYMGGRIFICENKDGTYELILNNSKINHSKNIIGYNPNNKLPMIEVIFDNGEHAYLGNDYQFHSNFIEAYDFYKFCRDGKILDYNKVIIYEKCYITYNNLDIIPQKQIYDLGLNENSWVALSSLNLVSK